MATSLGVPPRSLITPRFWQAAAEAAPFFESVAKLDSASDSASTGSWSAVAKPPPDARSTHTADVIQDSDYARVDEAIGKMRATNPPGFSTPNQPAWGFGMGVEIEQAAGSAERRPRKPDSGGSVASSITLESLEPPPR